MFLEKGKFEDIDTNMVDEFSELFKKLAVLQKKFNLMDSDSAINEVRDSKVAKSLGYGKINVMKHGMDAMSSSGKTFLEVKNASITSKSLNAVFNDTNMEKAQIFQRDDTFITLSVWHNLNDLAFSVYGQNKALGEYLEERVIAQTAKSQRRTQSIPLPKLIKDFDFNVIAPDGSCKQTVYSLIQSKYKSIDKILKLEDIKYYSELTQ